MTIFVLFCIELKKSKTSNHKRTDGLLQLIPVSINFLNFTSFSMIILGIDPGTCITGYGIISYKNGLTSVIDFGCIKPPAKIKLEQKYLIIFEAIESLIETHRPDYLSIESQFVYKNAQSALKLGMAKAMAILAATKRGIPICEYPPKQVKLAITGNGSSSKDTVQTRIQLLLSLREPPTPQDASDALSLALCHAHKLQTKLKLSKGL